MSSYESKLSSYGDTGGLMRACWMQTVLSKVGAALASVALFASPVTYMAGASAVNYLYNYFYCCTRVIPRGAL